MDSLSVTALVASLGFLGGVALGATARAAQFCTLGAIADAFITRNQIRMRGWALAIATAIVVTQGLHMAGLIDLYGAPYLSPSFGWLGAIVGGLCFGFGMALVGTCAYGNLVRLGGGDLKALVDFFVLGFFAYMTLRGLTGLGRVSIIEATNLDLSALGSQGLVDGLAWLLAADPETVRAPVVALFLTLLLFYCFRDPGFRTSRRDVWAGLSIGVLVSAGWAVTGIVGADDFEPVPLESFTFVAPLGESLVYLMTFSGATINFGIATVGGVIVGAWLVALHNDELRLESFDEPKEMLRHLSGAALMGFGGVVALGCTIGQGVTGLSTLSMGSPLALASIFLGAWLGLRYLIEGSLLAAFRPSALSR